MRNKDKIQKRVADLLGMSMPDDDPIGEDHSLVPVPEQTEIATIENAELPDLAQELLRLEHGQRQQEILLDRGMAATMNMLCDLDKTPPMYKGKVALAVAELYKAVADLNKAKIKSQLDIVKVKLELASYVKSKTGAAPQTISGNTIIFNREELIKKFGTPQFHEDDEDEEDDES